MHEHWLAVKYQEAPAAESAALRGQDAAGPALSEFSRLMITPWVDSCGTVNRTQGPG
jgi:hypothetical protein